MTYQISIAEVGETGIGERIVFETRASYDVREIINQLAAGWQMSVNRVCFINGHFVAFGNPITIRQTVANCDLSLLMMTKPVAHSIA